MKNYCTYTLDKDAVDKDVDMVLQRTAHSIHNRMLLNADTVKLLTGKTFFDVRKQQYGGIGLVEDPTLKPGEIVFLTEFAT